MNEDTGNGGDYYLVLNAGSSSVKFAGYDAESLKPLFSGQIDDKGGNGSALLSVNEGDTHHEWPLDNAETDDRSGLSATPILGWLKQKADAGNLLGIGHRVVHGGEKFQEPVLIDEAVLTAIESCVPFAPLHNPANLQGIRDCQSLYPDLPQVAVFDTAFHQSLAAAQYLYALPYEWYENHGVRRYGFHGTSHEYVYQQAEKSLGLDADTGAFITLHLGNGCSAAAIECGRSVDTTMGLTPLEGLMMGTRSGDIDPGLPQYLCSELDQSIDDITHSLNKSSGLLGISRLTSDMRDIQEAMENQNQQAALAFDMFCFRAAKAVAAMRVSLQSLDAVIFTGGIGEHSARVRAQIISHLSWLCSPLDPDANRAHGKQSDGVITRRHKSDSYCYAMVVPTDEERMIASHIRSLMKA